jgi:gamma-glutamyl phosphate reductase
MNKPIFSVEVARQNIEKSYQDNREVIISYINSQIENASKKGEKSLILDRLPIAKKRLFGNSNVFKQIKHLDCMNRIIDELTEVGYIAQLYTYSPYDDDSFITRELVIAIPPSK